MKNLENDINLLLGQKVTYSRTGGGAGSILLIKFENDCALWLGDIGKSSRGTN